MEKQIKVIGLNAKSSHKECLEDRVQSAINEINIAPYSEVNIIKVHFDDDVTALSASKLIKNIGEAFRRVGCFNCVFIPISNSLGIKDVTIDRIEVVNNV